MSKLKAALNPEKREMTPYDRFRLQLNLVRVDIAGLVGDRNVDKFVRVCLNAVQANPDTLGADRRSLLLACMKAAQDGLLPDGREAVFNVYNTKVKKEGREEWIPVVQYLPMSYGLIQKIYEAGASYVDAVPVYEKDAFDYQRGDEPKITHKPYDGADSPGEVKAAYVIVKLKTGETKREVMFKRDIDRVRQKSKAKDGLMWKDFYDQAAVKSVIHRVVKQLPRSVTLERTLAHDNEAVGLEEVTVPVDQTGSNLEELVDTRFDEARGVKVEPVPEQTPDPKPGYPGTPALKETFMGRLQRSDDPDVLDLVKDDIDFHQWSDADKKELTDVYTSRKQDLGIERSTRSATK